MAVLVAVTITTTVTTAIAPARADALAGLNTLTNAGYLVTDSAGNVLHSKRHLDSFIPASTTKLVTAWLALNHWGEGHRFSTPFYIDRQQGKLWVKGGGDPFLVSEELEIIATEIARLNPGQLTEIALDASLFEANLVVPGATVTNNPYDAVPSAIAANFNTIYLEKAAGSVVSAEPQTPLTQFALQFADEIKGQSLRINTGRQSMQSERYFAELLQKFLNDKGVLKAEKISWGTFPQVTPDYVHYNSRTLGEILQAMLKYSTNFIANQIILTLAGEVSGEPANFKIARRYMHDNLRRQFNWKNFTLHEGAGLSPLNRIAPQQLADLLLEFKPWRHLLTEVETGVFAKTGTLTNVSSLAGYINSAAGERVFAFMVNENVSSTLMREVALDIAANR